MLLACVVFAVQLLDSFIARSNEESTAQRRQHLFEQTATALEYQGHGWRDANSNTAFAAKPVSTDAHPICPVCEMEVDPATSLHEAHNGRTYYFCSPDDQKRFDVSPDRFVN